MQVPESWLRSFCNPNLGIEELAEGLTMAGLEVEELRAAAPDFRGVVVARVLEVTPHPDADRLRVCRVDAGGEAPLQIVCGAPNVAAGMKVPCAVIGAELPPAEAGGKAFRIGAARMRGVDSQGMLCSARELGLSTDHSGLLALDEQLVVGQDVREALRLDERVLEIKLTPNLGHCMSVYGVARELSAITGAELVQPRFEPVVPTLQDRLPVRVLADDLCGRFSGRVIRGVDARAPTPAWLRQRLERAGQRSISALVDISNYVMLELGRPTHVFDLDRIDGGLEVRWGRAGESLELLNGQTVQVDERVGVIAAGKGIESLAGIMGGEATAVSLDTRNVYVEAAFWWPQSIRGRARRYNFSTDAGARFERGVDPGTTVEHLEYITRLILDVCGGQAGPVDDQRLRLPERKPVAMRVARCERIIGTPVGAERMAQIFQRLGLRALREGQGAGERFVVTPPSHRFDLEIEEDLVEEVARIHGYANIPVRAPLARMSMLPEPEGRRSQHALRLALVERGYQETIQFSFAEPEWESDLAGNPNPIALRNPISAQAGVMRSSLLGGLLQTLRANLNQRARRARLFEVGRVFLRAPGRDDLQPAGVEQPTRVGGLAYGPVMPTGWAAPERPVDFYDVKADVQQLCAGCGELRFEPVDHPALHPGRAAAVLIDGQRAGVLGELHPRWVQKYALPHAPILFELDAATLQTQQIAQPHALPRTPTVLRDLAFVLEASVPAAKVLELARELRGGDARCAILADAVIFDVFPLPDTSTRSLALRLSLQAEETLTDAQADAACAAVVEAMQRAFDARLRA